jgi:CHASE3 domain sensor protein
MAAPADHQIDPTGLTTDQLLREISHLREFIGARLDGMDKAIDAALQSQKEAIHKSEASFTKQIDGQATMILATAKAMEDRFGDMKDRMVKVETATVARTQGHMEVWGYVVGGLGIAAILFTIADKFLGSGTQ